MAKAHKTWTILENGPIEELSESVWRVEGALPGMALRRVMTVVRKTDGRLLVHNAMALDDASMARLEAWGTPTWLVVPNGWHRLDAPAFAARYPDMAVFGPRGSRKHIEQVLPLDGTYDEFPSDDELTLRHLEGVKQAEGVLVARSKDGATLVFNDALFNQDHLPGVGGLVMRLLGSTGGPKVTRIGRLLLLKDKKAFRADLERLAATPDLRRVIVSHGRVIADDPAGTLRRIAATL